MTINTINQSLNQQQMSENEPKESSYKVKKFLRWFEKQGENLVGEKHIPSSNIEELQKLFNVDSNNPMYDCYLLENKEQFDYFENELNILLNDTLYDYYLEADSLNIVYSICLLVNFTQGNEGGYLILEKTPQKPYFKIGDTITKIKKVPYKDEFRLGNRDFNLSLTLIAIDESILEDSFTSPFSSI